jgi:predicted nuclease of predicted toxin-antitoxin system
MDEHVPHGITVQLRLRAVDVLTVQEDGYKGKRDEDVFERAATLERVLYTQDDDFLNLARRKLAQGERFSGLIYSHQLRASVGVLVRELELTVKVMEPEEVANTVMYLPL